MVASSGAVPLRFASELTRARHQDPDQRPRDKRGARPGGRARPPSTALTRGYGRPAAGICPPLREGSEMYIGIGTLVAILIIVLLVILIF
jgi:hypothetical protein